MINSSLTKLRCSSSHLLLHLGPLTHHWHFFSIRIWEFQTPSPASISVPLTSLTLAITGSPTLNSDGPVSSTKRSSHAPASLHAASIIQQTASHDVTLHHSTHVMFTCVVLFVVLMMCCSSLFHIITIGWLHPFPAFLLIVECFQIFFWAPHPLTHSSLCQPQSFVLRHTGATSTARRLWAAPSALRNVAPRAGASLRSQAPPSSTYQTSACALSRTCNLSR